MDGIIVHRQEELVITNRGTVLQVRPALCGQVLGFIIPEIRPANLKLRWDGVDPLPVGPL